jgi:hypothetical protein
MLDRNAGELVVAARCEPFWGVCGLSIVARCRWLVMAVMVEEKTRCGKELFVGGF